VGGTNQTEIVSMKLDVTQPAQRPEGVSQVALMHKPMSQIFDVLCDRNDACSSLHKFDCYVSLTCSYHPRPATGTSSQSPSVIWRCAAPACCQSGMCEIAF
jgi:hypothetical protein